MFVEKSDGLSSFRVVVILMLPCSQNIYFKNPILFLTLTESSKIEELISLNHEYSEKNLG